MEFNPWRNLSRSRRKIRKKKQTVAAPEKEAAEVIMERTISMNAIPGFKGYLFGSGGLKGIDEDAKYREFEKIDPVATINDKQASVTLDDFFSIGGTLYFSFTDRYTEEGAEQPTEEQHFFSQESGTVSEIDALPDVPETAATEGTFGPFEFIVYEWEGAEYNKLIRDGEIIVTTSKMLDSHVLTSQGMYFSKPDNIGRASGLWFMPMTGSTPYRLSDYARIW